jgi:hypothetical protein
MVLVDIVEFGKTPRIAIWDIAQNSCSAWEPGFLVSTRKSTRFARPYFKVSGR